MSQDLLKGCLDLIILTVVAGQPSHGYAIICAVRERSAGVFNLPEGTVYPVLHRLDETGMLRSHWVAVAGRRRRVYEITAAGRAALAERRRAWQVFSWGVRSLLGGTA